MTSVTNVPYLKYAVIRVQNPETFLTAHRISQMPEILREAAIAAESRTMPYGGIAIGMCYVVLATALISMQPNKRSLAAELALLTCGCGAVWWLWYKEEIRPEEHRIAEVRRWIAERDYLGPAGLNDPEKEELQSMLNRRIREAIAKIAKSGDANFTPVQFENERIYYEQVLTPFLKQQHKIDLPPFVAVEIKNMEGLPKAIQDYLKDLVTIREAVKGSRLGYVSLEAELINRLRAGKGLPPSRPNWKFELEAISGQPDTVAAHDAIYSYQKNLANRNCMALLAAGLGIAGVLIALTIPRFQLSKKRSSDYFGIAARCGIGTILCLVCGIEIHTRLAAAPPWVTTSSPAWLSTVGIEKAWHYIREQSFLVSP